MPETTETSSIVESQPVIEKVSATEIKISREIVETIVRTSRPENTYTKDFLLTQIADITAQRDQQEADEIAGSAARVASIRASKVAELAECNLLLVEAEKAGLKTSAQVAQEAEEALAVENEGVLPATQSPVVEKNNQIIDNLNK